MLILDYSSTKKIWGRNFQTSNSLSSQGSRGKQKKNLMFFLEIWKFTTPSILGPFNGRVWTCMTQGCLDPQNSNFWGVRILRVVGFYSLLSLFLVDPICVRFKHASNHHHQDLSLPNNLTANLRWSWNAFVAPLHTYSRFNTSPLKNGMLGRRSDFLFGKVTFQGICFSLR